MNNEEKILAVLEKIDTRMDTLETGQAALEGRLDRIGSDQKFTNLELRNLEAKQAAFEGRMGRLEAALTGLQESQAQLQDDITSIKLRLELDVKKRFDAVNEGIDAILAQLTPKRKVEEMDADIVVLKAAVKMLTQEVAELKKTQ